MDTWHLRDDLRPRDHETAPAGAAQRAAGRLPGFPHAWLCVLALVVAGLAFTACSDRPAPPPPDEEAGTDLETAPRPPDVAEALATLRTIGQLENEAVGYAGIPSEGAKAFGVLWRSPQRTALFTELARTGSPAGKLYALIALRELAPDAAGRLHDRLVDDETPASSMVGCIVAVTTVADLVERIDRGRWDGVIEFARQPPESRQPPR